MDEPADHEPQLLVGLGERRDNGVGGLGVQAHIRSGDERVSLDRRKPRDAASRRSRAGCRRRA